MTSIDPWTTETGLLETWEGVITSAQFVVDANYNAETLLLELTFSVTDPPVTLTERISCGKGWIPADGGRRAVHVSGQPRRFNANSHMGRVLERLAELGAVDDLRSTGLTPMDASLWEGIEGVWKREEREFTIEGETRRSSKAMPVLYKGRREPGRERAVPSVDLLDLARSCPDHSTFVTRALSDPAVASDEALVRQVVDPNGIWAQR